MTRHGFVFEYSKESGTDFLNEWGTRTCAVIATDKEGAVKSGLSPKWGEAKPYVLLTLDEYEKLLLTAADAAESRLQDREWMDDIMGARHVA